MNQYKNNTRIAIVAMFSTVCLLLSACASVLSPMTISEGELASYLKETVRKFDRQQLLNGIPLKFDLNQANIDIGPDNREIIRMDLGGEIALNAVLLDIPANIKMTVEALPVFDREKKAIFIRRLRLIDSDISTTFLEKFKLDDTTAKLAVGTLAKLLEQVPVYRLDESNFAERLVSLSGLNMKVESGKLVFVKED